ncbi:MAG: trigger factor [Alphaproteobacteria bacterium]|nr:trigger factor [Alphaproteobacteria bacterium]
MTATVTKKDGLKRELKITVPASEMTKKIEDRLLEVSKEIKVPGFRPGHVPLDFVQKKYGKAVQDEMVEKALQESTDAAFYENKLKPALRPKVGEYSYEPEKDLEFTVEVEIFPEIKDKKFEDIEVEKLTADVTEEEIQKSLDRLVSSRKETEPLKEERPSKEGDTLVIDFNGKVNGIEFKGGKGSDFNLELGSNTFIEGFEGQLIGKNKGDKVVVKVTFPEEYHAKELAGKPAEFDVEIKDICQSKKVELNDEFAKSFGKDSLAELKDLIKEELQKEYTQVSKTHLKRALLDALADVYDFEVPEGMLSLEFDAIWKDFSAAKKRGDLDEDEKKKSEKDLKAEYKEIAERRVRLGLLLADIAQKNKIVVSQEDLTKAIINEAKRYPGQEKMVFEYYSKNPKLLENMKAPIFEEKVVDFVLSKVSLKEKKLSVQDLYAWDPDAKKKTTKAKK